MAGVVVERLRSVHRSATACPAKARAKTHAARLEGIAVAVPDARCWVDAIVRHGATGRRYSSTSATCPDPGSWGAALESVLAHPSMDPGTPEPTSEAARRQFTRRVLASFRKQGAQKWSDRQVEAELCAIWEGLRPAVAARFGVDLPPRVRLVERGSFMLEARALPDGSILFHRNDIELVRSTARAVAAADDNGWKLLLNLARVARVARSGEFEVTFDRCDPEVYRRILAGVLTSVLGHELAHLAADHTGVDFDTEPRSLVQVAALEARLASYFPARSLRRYGLDGIVAGRPLLVAQALEADADRAAVDLALAIGSDPDGLMIDALLTALLDLGKDPVGNHPPGLYRFDDVRRRLRNRGVPALADGVTHGEIQGALRAVPA